MDTLATPPSADVKRHPAASHASKRPSSPSGKPLLSSPSSPSSPVSPMSPELPNAPSGFKDVVVVLLMLLSVSVLSLLSFHVVDPEGPSTADPSQGGAATWSPFPLDAVLPAASLSQTASSSSVTGPASILSQADSRALIEQSTTRLFRARGFIRCPILDNSLFDALAPIPALNGTVLESNPTLQRFTSLVDTVAAEIETRIVNLADGDHHFLDPIAVRRLSCRLSAEGDNMMANLTSGGARLVKKLDGATYLADVLPARTARTLQPGDGAPMKMGKESHKLAFLITIHGEAKVLEEELIPLIESLDDGAAFFLVHVDARSGELWNAVGRWIATYCGDQRLAGEGNATITESAGSGDEAGACNVALAQHRYSVMWGHASMLWAQLSGYFELLDLSDGWDVVINLSVADVPLRQSREIYRFLSRKENAGRNFISYRIENNAATERFTRPHLPRRSMEGIDPKFGQWSHHGMGLVFPFFTNWKVCHGDQWMMLTRRFVEHLRVDDVAAQALAFFENAWLPDQSYFCEVAINSAEFSHTVVNDMKRFQEFKEWDHPRWLNMDYRHRIGTQFFTQQEPKYFFVRKVDRSSVEGKALVEWIRVNHLEQHVLEDEEYNVDFGGNFTRTKKYF
ncbi:Xylosyltransferase 1 [Irineochytrium annulatum]|nr:Xylosyltransferase 1 [Irineochytrium annulatum]